MAENYWDDGKDKAQRFHDNNQIDKLYGLFRNIEADRNIWKEIAEKELTRRANYSSFKPYNEENFGE